MEIEVKCPLKTYNGKAYSQDAFKKAFEEYKEASKLGMYGGLEHPETYNQLPINNLSNIAIKIDDIQFDDEQENEFLNAKIELLNTPNGQIAKRLYTSDVPMKIEPRIGSNPETGEIQVFGFDFVIDQEAAIRKEILDFIKHFQNKGTIETFTEGCCYWFARILCERFDMSLYKTIMMYNNIDGHFAAKINGRLYDITGELNETADWKMWDEFRENEPIYANTVIRDSIKKLG